MSNHQTINQTEVAKFHAHAHAWWDLNGPFKTLHHLNPTRKAFIESFGPVKDKTILDVGCGGGILAESLAQCGARVTGIDAEPASIETAIAHAKPLNLNLDYHHTPIETFNEGPYDLITCFELLEHVDNPQTIIEHTKRLLKPGGLLFLSTINRTLKAYIEAIVLAEYVLGLIPKQTHDYAKCIRPSELAAMLREQAFEVIQLKGIGYNPLLQRAYLKENVQVNYVMVGEKELNTSLQKK